LQAGSSVSIDEGKASGQSNHTTFLAVFKNVHLLLLVFFLFFFLSHPYSDLSQRLRLTTNNNNNNLLT
jgi:hypothetical protein